MTKKKLFLAVQALLCLATGIFFAVTAVFIYRDGSAWIADGHPLDWIYSREIIAERFAPILPLLAVSVLFTVIGLALGIKDEESDKLVRDTEIARDLTVARVSTASDAMRAETKRQNVIRIAGWVGFAICMLPIILYLANGENLSPGALEPVFLALIRHILPWIVTGLICLMIMTALLEASMVRETEAAKAQIQTEKKAGIRPAQTTVSAVENNRTGRIVRAVVFAAAVLLIIAGVMTGNAREVLVKAINICTECVGLG